MARFRENVILQYSLATLLIVAVVTTSLGFIVSSALTDFQLRSHIRLYPDIIRQVMRDHEELIEAISAPEGTAISSETEKLLRGFLTLDSIFKVKVWSPSARIVWSNEKGLIGNRIEDDGAFQIAMGGRLTYKLGWADATENTYERDKGVTLEVYTPIVRAGETVGVIELYEANRDLFSEIAKNTLSVWLTISGSGIVMYLFLFLLFYRSHVSQRKAREQLIATQDVTIFALAYQAELRDKETGKHLDRTSIYVRLLAEELRQLPSLKEYLTPGYIEDLVKSSPLHDIGKVGVPDSILLKPGKLDEEEWAQMKQHCELGALVLTKAQQRLQFQSFLTIAAQLAIGHHEKWNGKGYPKGLAGERIPLSARIMALSDVYDALRSRRSYKDPILHSDCVEIIRNERGEHFDPKVVDAFLRCEAEFARISEEFADAADA